MSMEEELVPDFECLLRKRSAHGNWKRLGLVEIDVKYISLDKGMRLIRKGREETASGRIEHMETKIFATDIKQLQT